MTFDQKNQRSIEEGTMSAKECELRVQKLREEIERFEMLRKQKILHEEQKPKKEKVSGRNITSAFPDWLYEAFVNDFMPLFQEKVHFNRSKFEPAVAIRYLVMFAVMYPQLIKGVSLEECKKSVGAE